MKNKFLLVLFFVVIILFQACEEEPPYINFAPDSTVGDTTYIKLPAPTPQAKNVLIEEYTGVRCPNCPKAQSEAKLISDNNPGRINILTIHTLGGIYNPLTTPFDEARGDKHTSKFDFRTDPGTKINQLTGPGVTSSLPLGNINRKLFSGESVRNIEYQKWSSKVTEELGLTTPANINIQAKNIADSIEIELTVTYTETVADSNYVTVIVLESEMEDVQESRDNNGNSIYVENYIHKHVLRGVVTDYYGDLLKASYEPGRVFYKKYRIKRDPKWNPAHLDVLAMVHLNTTKKNVLHSKEVKVN